MVHTFMEQITAMVSQTYTYLQSQQVLYIKYMPNLYADHTLVNRLKKEIGGK